MPETQLQRVTDLSRLNWKGWLLLTLTIIFLFCGVIAAGLPETAGGMMDYRGGRKILACGVAFMSFAGFITVASGLRKIGISIWKPGLDPLDHLEPQSEDGPPAVLTAATIKGLEAAESADRKSSDAAQAASVQSPGNGPAPGSPAYSSGPAVPGAPDYSSAAGNTTAAVPSNLAVSPDVSHMADVSNVTDVSSATDISDLAADLIDSPVDFTDFL
ncbi:MAG: hypothetical protein NXI04_09845 [Planctomycetaceae bacterium]|nr:hypothetical protein [Planctomycetaceae bacterium]